MNASLPFATCPAEAYALAVEVFGKPDSLPADVRDFMTEGEAFNVGCGFAWYRNLASTVYPDDSWVRFFVLRAGRRILAVLPLRANKAWLGWHVTSLANFYTTLYEPVLVAGLEPAAMAKLLLAVQDEFPRLVSLTLAPMDPGRESYRTMLGAMRLRGWIPYEYFCFGNWYLPVTCDWTQYLAERTSTLRSTIRRMSKKFAAAGGTLQILTQPEQLDVGIAAYERVYASSWKRPEPFPDFAPGLLKTYADKGFLRLGIAWLGEQPIAVQLWIVSHGRAEIYKVAYDEAFKAFSPGTLVTAMLLEHALETDKVAEVDYLIGEDTYKTTWMSHRRERWGMVAYNPRSFQGIAGLLREAGGRRLKPLREWFQRLVEARRR